MDTETPPPRTLPGQLAEVILHGMASRCAHLVLHAVVDLRGTVDAARLRAAAGQLVAAFPVLGCRYRPGPWRDRWVPWAGEAAERVTVARDVGDLDGATRLWVRRTFRHLEEPPWAIAAFEHAAGTRLVLSAHHMLADGGGIKAMLGVLGAALAGEPAAPAPGATRSLLAPLRGVRARDVPVLAAELAREVIQPLSMLRVRRLARGIEVASAPQRPDWRSVRLDGEAAARFVGRCRRAGATINDGLVAAVARRTAARGDRGPVATGFTLDLRRFLPRREALVTNLHAVAVVALPRARLADPEDAIAAVVEATGRRKRRLYGLAYALLPALLFGWWPHALLRVAGGRFIRTLLGYLDRGLVVTNIGPLDEALRPWGDAVADASIVGPFVKGLRVPVAVATGFRGALTVQVCSDDPVAPGAAAALAHELRAELGGRPRGHPGEGSSFGSRILA